MPQSFQQAINEHVELIHQLGSLEQEITAAIEVIKSAFQRNKKLLVCGNGGSASDSQHFVSEFTGRFEKDRKGFPAFALTTDTSALTAIGNDYGFDRIFARQIESIGQEEDVLIVISTSGNSSNLQEAVRQAKAKNLKTIALLGRDGGELKDLVDLAIIAPGQRTSRIQESHIFILHWICQAFEA